MSIATSKRNYLSQDELEQLADITITDEDEADDQISQAEEMIDSFVGPQDKFLEDKIEGRAAGGGPSTITLQSDQQNVYDVDYFKYCYIEILGGTGAGETNTISGSTLAGVLTVQDQWGTAPDSTSFYRISQLAKFPRECDVTHYNLNSPATYYKSIPDAVKRAVAAQVQFIIEMGTDFFSTDKSTKTSESIGDYSYTNAGGSNGGGIGNLISPKAKLLLKGIINRVGSIVR